MTESMTRATALAEAVSVLREAKAAIGTLPDGQVGWMLEIHDRWVTLAWLLPSGDTREPDTAKPGDDGLPVVRSFRMNEATAARLGAVAKARGMSASDLIREGVQAAINTYSGDADE